MTLFCIPLDERPLDEDLIADDDPLREWKLTAVMRLMLFNRRCDMIVRDAVRRHIKVED